MPQCTSLRMRYYVQILVCHRYRGTSKIQETAGQRCFGISDHAIVNLHIIIPSPRKAQTHLVN